MARDPLGFPGYEQQLRDARASASADESVVTGPAKIGGHAVELAAFDFGFLGGSMGEVAGERIAQAIERAADRRVPFVLRTQTGGARMQEGMRALVQMPKLIVARARLTEVNQPFVAVLGHPTTGGVLASIAALADVTVAEDGATIGFAGPRVVERVTGEPVGNSSHHAHAALNSGLVDMVESTDRLPDYLARVLTTLAPATPIALPDPPEGRPAASEDPWEIVGAARADERPRAPHLIPAMSDSCVQLRGDRAGHQDPSIVPFLARVAGRPMLVIGLDRKFAPGPGGFRKARRCVGIAVRLGLPIVTLVDTRGADPSPASEGGGIAWEIAALFEAILSAPVPVLSIVTGEGGSGGALAFAVGDRLVAYESSIFSVIAPELAAEILWRDTSRAREAATALKLTARDLVALGIADALVGEPLTAESLRNAVAYHLGYIGEVQGDDRLTVRRRRWRRRPDAD